MERLLRDRLEGRGAPLARRRGRAPLGARRGGTEALRGPPPARRRERRKRRFASRRRLRRLRLFERRRLFFNGVDRVRPRRPTRRVASRCDGYSKNGIGIAAGRGGSRAGRRARDHLARRFSLEKKRLEKPERVGDARVPGPRRRFVSVVVVEIVVREPSRRVKWWVWKGLEGLELAWLRVRLESPALPSRTIRRRRSPPLPGDATRLLRVCTPHRVAPGRRPSPAA